MPAPGLASNLPSFEVDGVERPLLGASLQSLVITWPRSGHVTLAATFNDWGSVGGGPPGYLWSDGGIVKTGVTVAVRFGADVTFQGKVAVVESHLADSTAPLFSLRAKARAPAGNAAPPRTLRWAEDVLRMDAAIDAVGPKRSTRRIDAETLADVALGSGALRPDMPIDIVGAGSMFNGPYVLTEVSLHFDLVAGLGARLTARSDPR